MAKYTVYLTTTATTAVEVDAENPDEALDKAYDAGMPTICAQCSGWGKGYNLDMDGEWEASEVINANDQVVWPQS